MKLDRDGLHINILSNIIFLIIVTLNIFMFYFMKNNYKKRYGYGILWSIISFNMYFIMEIIRFFISLINPFISARIWAFPQIGIGLGIVFLIYFLLGYPVKEKKVFYRFIFLILNLMIVFSLGIISTWSYFADDEVFIKFWGFSDYSVIIFYQSSIMLSLGLIMGILYKNYRKNMRNREGQTSYFIFKRFLLMFSAIFIFIFAFFVFKLKEPFYDYYGLIITAVYMMFSFTIMTGIFEFQFYEKFTYITKIFLELYKYNILLLIFIFCYNCYDMSLIQAILLVLTGKIIVDHTFSKILKNEYERQETITKIS